jgi:hypothetical protein
MPNQNRTASDVTHKKIAKTNYINYIVQKQELIDGKRMNIQATSGSGASNSSSLRHPIRVGGLGIEDGLELIIQNKVRQIHNIVEHVVVEHVVVQEETVAEHVVVQEEIVAEEPVIEEGSVIEEEPVIIQNFIFEEEPIIVEEAVVEEGSVVEEEPVIIQDFVFEEEPIIIAEPVVEPVEEPVVEHVAEPVIEPVIEPIEEPVVEPVTMPSVSNLNSSLKLLILGDIYVETVANTIRSKLISLGYTNCTVHAKQVFSDYTGATLNITNYSTVLLWTSASQIGSTELYTTLKTFVAQGGNVISSIFLHALYPSGFDFTITPYIFEKQSSDSTGDMTFDLVHPITNGLVSSITNGLHILINNPVSIQSDATSIASFTSSKASYVAVQTVGSSRIVGINAYMTDLSHQNFCALVVNTCLWASGILE